MVIPARDEHETVGSVVAAFVGVGVHEVVVVDDGSSDRTAAEAAAAGARVVESQGGPGKGQALRAGVAGSTGDVVLFCDADLRSFDAAELVTLVDPLVAGAAIVKARYQRALDGRVGEGGRVNELVARPALKLLHPELAWVSQPLGGEYAAWREVLDEVPFVHGYGVDLGLLIDIARRFGADRVAEVEIGVRHHRNRKLAELAPHAEVALRVALARAGMAEAPPESPPLSGVLSRRTA